MSVRLSTTCPRACSGLMYAAVPSTTPAPVRPTVGKCEGSGRCRPASAGLRALASPKSSDLDHAVRADLDVGRFQIAMDDPLLVRGFERFGDLPRDDERLGPGESAPRSNAIAEGVALDQFENDR